VFFFLGGGGGGGGGGGKQFGNDEYTSKNSKNVDFDSIMNAFFHEGNKRR